MTNTVFRPTASCLMGAVLLALSSAGSAQEDTYDVPTKTRPKTPTPAPPASARPLTAAEQAQFNAISAQLQAESRAIQAEQAKLQNDQITLSTEQINQRQAAITARAQNLQAANARAQAYFRALASGQNPGALPTLTSPGTALTVQQRISQASATQRAATVITVADSVFTYAPGCRWLERVNGQLVRTYREQGRQRSSQVLRLKNEDTDGYLTFNFYSNELNFNNSAINAPIVSVGSVVDHTNVTAVSFPGGTLKMKTCSTKEWVERGTAAGSGVNAFVETGRGAGAVGMFDPLRQVQLQITPGKSAIHYSSASEPNPRLIHDTTSATAVQFFNFAVVD